MSLMLCPKCAYQRLPSDTHVHAGVCPSCGIAYQKYIDRQRHGPPVETPLDYEEVPAIRAVVAARLLESPARVDSVAVGGRALAWSLFAVWTLWFSWHGLDWEIIGSSFMHRVILPFHEFGHVLFRPLGRFMAILGGSLFQVTMPLGLMLAFILKQRDTFGASIMLWWAGQSLVDVAPYIEDAPLRHLPLIGGGGGEGHDWGNMLTMLGWLDHARALALLSFWMGLLVMFTALAWGALLLRLQYAKLQSSERLAATR